MLTPHDVEDHLDRLQAAGASVQCCLTVWEGYRHLMALANARLGYRTWTTSRSCSCATS